MALTNLSGLYTSASSTSKAKVGHCSENGHASRERRQSTSTSSSWPPTRAQRTIYFDRDLKKTYVMTLCHAHELRSLGVTEIKHGQPAAYYNRFFKDGSPRLPPLVSAPVALEIEVEALSGSQTHVHARGSGEFLEERVLPMGSANSMDISEQACHHAEAAPEDVVTGDLSDDDVLLCFDNEPQPLAPSTPPAQPAEAVIACEPVSAYRSCSVGILSEKVPYYREKGPWRTGEKVAKIQILLLLP